MSTSDLFPNIHGLNLIGIHQSSHIHGQSQLLQLPAEIRLEILRRLLVREQPIEGRSTYQKPAYVKKKLPNRGEGGRFVPGAKRMVEGYNLTPAILRTCRKLYSEGFPVLYHENLLQIAIKITSYPGTRITTPVDLVISGQIDVLGFMGEMEMMVDRLFLNTLKTTAQDPNEILADRFRKIMVVIEPLSNRAQLALLRHMLRKNAAFFKYKEVKVKVLNRWAPFIMLHHLDGCIDTLRAFSVIRCRKLHFLEIDDDVSTAVQNLLTSNKDIVDLSDYMTSPVRLMVIIYFSRSFSPRSGPPSNVITEIRSKACQLVDRLILAVQKDDVSAFLQARYEALKFWTDLVSTYVARTWRFDVTPHRHAENTIRSGRGTDAVREFQVIESGSPRLGFEVGKDGREMNERLVKLAIDYDFMHVKQE